MLRTVRRSGRIGRSVRSMTDQVMTLQEVADELGVHYMTVYRYVRLGQLDARKVGGGWRVTRDVFDDFQSAREAERPAGRRVAPWSERLESRLLVGDASGAWGGRRDIDGRWSRGCRRLPRCHLPGDALDRRAMGER